MHCLAQFRKLILDVNTVGMGKRMIRPHQWATLLSALVPLSCCHSHIVSVFIMCVSKLDGSKQYFFDMTDIREGHWKLHEQR